MDLKSCMTNDNECIENNNNNDDADAECSKPIEECIELKNINYKTMLLKGASIKNTLSNHDLSGLDTFLENEKNNNKFEPWCKLNKTIKIQKLIEFANLYKEQNNLDEPEKELLISFFKDSLERKKLQRVKDVSYDKDAGIVREVPTLVFNKTNKHFTLKRQDKRVSTLKSLPQKKVNGSIRNKDIE